MQQIKHNILNNAYGKNLRIKHDDGSWQQVGGRDFSWFVEQNIKKARILYMNTEKRYNPLYKRWTRVHTSDCLQIVYKNHLSTSRSKMRADVGGHKENFLTKEANHGRIYMN